MRSARLHRALAHALLRRTRHGTITLVEDGRELTFGDPTDDVHARMELVDPPAVYRALLRGSLGLALAWIPALLHGPIAAKFDLLYIKGGVAVVGWHLARASIGFLVGNTRWPRQWYLRGPLCGFVFRRCEGCRT